jgi:hypothetical protein
MLERRPDIQQAEQQLIAFNARIGVAKAAYFPQIGLTGIGGYRSSALGSLLSGPAGLWTLAAGLTQPIFSGGRIRAGVEFASAATGGLAHLSADHSTAFREVSDALVAYRKNQEFRQQQAQLVAAAQDASQLSETRYRAGLTSYLDVLTNETNSFTAELGLAQAGADELLAGSFTGIGRSGSKKGNYGQTNDPDAGPDSRSAGSLGFVKFIQIQKAIARVRLQPPPVAVTTIVARAPSGVGHQAIGTTAVQE